MTQFTPNKTRSHLYSLTVCPVRSLACYRSPHRNKNVFVSMAVIGWSTEVSAGEMLLWSEMRVAWLAAVSECRTGTTQMDRRKQNRQRREAATQKTFRWPMDAFCWPQIAQFQARGESICDFIPVNSKYYLLWCKIIAQMQFIRPQSEHCHTLKGCRLEIGR